MTAGRTIDDPGRSYFRLVRPARRRRGPLALGPILRRAGVSAIVSSRVL